MRMAEGVWFWIGSRKIVMIDRVEFSSSFVYLELDCSCY